MATKMENEMDTVFIYIYMEVCIGTMQCRSLDNCHYHFGLCEAPGITILQVI